MFTARSIPLCLRDRLDFQVPKLSVVVPFYNVLPFAPDLLRGLTNNAAPDTEFVLVDDHSTDGTTEVLGSWQRQQAHRQPGSATPIRHESNQGIAQARNTGLDAARGEYVTFLDGDDWYRPGYLAELVADIERLDCDFVRTSHIQATGRQRLLKRPSASLWDTVLRPRDAIVPAQEETMVDYPFVWAGIYRGGLFQNGGMRFSTGLRTAEDREWVWRLHLTAGSFAVTRTVGTFYRRGISSSLTQIRDGRQLDFMPAHDAILDDVTGDHEAERFLPKIVRTYCALIAFHMSNSGKYQSGIARKLRQNASAAMSRMPRHVLDRTLAEMDPQRADVLRRLRGDVRKAA
jgi:glycosyltransferase involved in cell wall biosynthesis